MVGSRQRLAFRSHRGLPRDTVEQNVRRFGIDSRYHEYPTAVFQGVIERTDLWLPRHTFIFDACESGVGPEHTVHDTALAGDNALPLRVRGAKVRADVCR
jgi:hypothetical protein